MASDDVTARIYEKFSSYPMRAYPKGQILVFAGSDPEFVFYLKKGKVRQYDISYRGDEVVVNVFHSPAFFPMSWAITKSLNRYFFRTEEECEIHIIPPDEAVEFIKSNPEELFDLLTRVYIGTEGLLGRIVHLMSGSARSRLLYEIIIECRRFGEKPKGSGKYLIQTNESDLAARAGLTRETVSREMSKLKQQSLVDINKKGIYVNDLSAIEEKIGYEI